MDNHCLTILKIILTSTNIGLNVNTDINMVKTPKEIQVEFAPGAFDHFEGTQEELDALQAEILEMFKNSTPEELQERARIISIDELEEMLESDDEEERITARRIITSILDQDEPNSGRNLQ